MDTSGTTNGTATDNGRQTYIGQILNGSMTMLVNLRKKVGTRMSASTYILPAGQSFAGISNATTRLSGAVLHVYGNETDYGHAIVVTGITGTGFGNITFCGNSPMRKAAKLSDYSQFTSHAIRVIIPYAMIRSRVCSSSGHTYASSSTGTSCYCTRCGDCKLTITGSLLRPLRVGEH